MLDIATHVDDPEGLEAAGIPIVTSEPIDLTFMEQLPADTQWFVQDRGRGLAIHQVLKLMQEIGKRAENSSSSYYQEVLREYYDDIADTILVIFGGLQKTNPATVSQHHILFSRLRWGESRGVGLILETGNLANTTNAMLLLPLLLEEQDIPHINDDELELPHIASLAEDTELTMSARTDDNRLIVGTEHAIGNGLGQSDDSLADDIFYQNAESLFVSDAQIIGYEVGLYGVFESYSISAAYDEQGTGIVRLVEQVSLSPVEEQVEQSASVVAQSPVNVRSAPNLDSQVITTVSPNATVTILEEQQVDEFAWYRIQLRNGRVGWIRGDFIRQE